MGILWLNSWKICGFFGGRNGSMRKKDLFLTTQNWKRIVATCSFSQGKPSKRRFFKA